MVSPWADTDADETPVPKGGTQHTASRLSPAGRVLSGYAHDEGLEAAVAAELPAALHRRAGLHSRGGSRSNSAGRTQPVAKGGGTPSALASATAAQGPSLSRIGVVPVGRLSADEPVKPRAAPPPKASLAARKLQPQKSPPLVWSPPEKPARQVLPSAVLSVPRSPPASPALQHTPVHFLSPTATGYAKPSPHATVSPQRQLQFRDSRDASPRTVGTAPTTARLEFQADAQSTAAVSTSKYDRRMLSGPPRGAPTLARVVRRTSDGKAGGRSPVAGRGGQGLDMNRLAGRKSQQRGKLQRPLLLRLSQADSIGRRPVVRNGTVMSKDISAGGADEYDPVLRHTYRALRKAARRQAGSAARAAATAAAAATVAAATAATATATTTAAGGGCDDIAPDPAHSPSFMHPLQLEADRDNDDGDSVAAPASTTTPTWPSTNATPRYPSPAVDQQESWSTLSADVPPSPSADVPGADGECELLRAHLLLICHAVGCGLFCCASSQHGKRCRFHGWARRKCRHRRQALTPTPAPTRTPWWRLAAST